MNNTESKTNETFPKLNLIPMPFAIRGGAAIGLFNGNSLDTIDESLYTMPGVTVTSLDSVGNIGFAAIASGISKTSVTGKHQRILCSTSSNSAPNRNLTFGFERNIDESNFSGFSMLITDGHVTNEEDMLSSDSDVFQVNLSAGPQSVKVNSMYPVDKDGEEIMDFSLPSFSTIKSVVSKVTPVLAPIALQLAQQELGSGVANVKTDATTLNSTAGNIGGLLGTVAGNIVGSLL